MYYYTKVKQHNQANSIKPHWYDLGMTEVAMYI